MHHTRKSDTTPKAEGRNSHEMNIPTTIIHRPRTSLGKQTKLSLHSVTFQFSNTADRNSRQQETSLGKGEIIAQNPTWQYPRSCHIYRLEARFTTAGPNTRVAIETPCLSSKDLTTVSVLWQTKCRWNKMMSLLDLHGQGYSRTSFCLPRRNITSKPCNSATYISSTASTAHRGFPFTSVSGEGAVNENWTSQKSHYVPKHEKP